jgi:general secretion pathway protein J
MISSTRDRRDPAGEAGFTLVEALVAITILSLLGLLIMTALRFGIKAWERGDTISAQINEGLQVQSLLRRLLGAAAPRFVPQPGGKGYVDFVGHPESVSFISDPPRSLDRGGRLLMTLSIDQEGGRPDFILSTRPELGAFAYGTAQSKRLLLPSVEAVSFRYFGAQQRGASAQWHSSWDKQIALPELVRIELRFLPGAPGFWPETVIAPRIDVDVSCSYDTLTQGCLGR